jgi:hypothetical protein
VAMRGQRELPCGTATFRRALLIWDESSGIETEALSALRDRTAEALRLPRTAPDEMDSRLQAELTVSLRTLESTAATYEQHRFSPGRLENLADALWHASQGYLNVLHATR